MSERSTPLERSSPQDGDLVVTRETHSPVHYTVRQVPGVVQFSAAVDNDAIRLAQSFGRRHSVDVWYSEAGTYRLLSTYRPRSNRGDRR